MACGVDASPDRALPTPGRSRGPGQRGAIAVLDSVGRKYRLSATVDLVVVGAGAAGLAATRRARELGLSVLLCEASGRIGGRAYTSTEPFGVPWDWGCHWLHSASINPFTKLADEYGFRYRSAPVAYRMRLGDRWASPDEQAHHDAYDEASYEAIIGAGREGRDVPAADVIDAADPAYWELRFSLNAEWGMDPSNVSTLDAARYRDTDENWPVQDGYGALVARVAAGTPVALNTAVTAIDWSGPRAKVTTSQGMVEAGSVIVTVSTGVLAAEVIAFSPALPDWKQEAIHHIPLGMANKVALQIDAQALDIPEHTSVLTPYGTQGAIGFQIRPFGWNIASAYLGGPLCSELERAGDAAMVDAVTNALVVIAGSDVRRQITASVCTGWEGDPLFRGAYAAAQPGQALARLDLARPIDNRLWFAGEATAPDFFSTCHGAHLTGIATVDAIHGEGVLSPSLILSK